MPGPIAPEVVRQIEKLAKAGYTRVAIAKATGVHRVTVGRHLGDSAPKATKNAANGLAAVSMTRTQAAKLAYILASFDEGVCPSCAKVMFALKGMTNGFCNHCSNMWTATPASRHVTAGGRR